MPLLHFELSLKVSSIIVFLSGNEQISYFILNLAFRFKVNQNIVQGYFILVKHTQQIHCE